MGWQSLDSASFGTCTCYPKQCKGKQTEMRLALSVFIHQDQKG